MSALLTLAKTLGINPGPLNQADLQEQTCAEANRLLIEQRKIISAQQRRISELLQETSNVQGN